MKNLKVINITEKLKNYKSPLVFNPYREVCRKYDQYDAAKNRFNYLTQLLEIAANTSIDYLWIGRDLGYRGGRRTGLALTDETHLKDFSKKWKIEVSKTTKGAYVKERTAKIIWSELQKSDKNIFLWNVFPFHPYEKGNQFTNRNHNAAERKYGEEILNDLVNLLDPNFVIAIGNDAHGSAIKIVDKKRVIKVRHPSYGGEREFRHQISTIL